MQSMTAAVCIRVSRGATSLRHRGCPYLMERGLHMLMFKRSQLYIGLGLAALAQIAFVAKFIIR